MAANPINASFSGSHPNQYIFIFALLMHAPRVIVSVMEMSCVNLGKINYYYYYIKIWYINAYTFIVIKPCIIHVVCMNIILSITMGQRVWAGSATLGLQVPADTCLKLTSILRCIDGESSHPISAHMIIEVSTMCTQIRCWNVYICLKGIISSDSSYTSSSHITYY